MATLGSWWTSSKDLEVDGLPGKGSQLQICLTLVGQQRGFSKLPRMNLFFQTKWSNNMIIDASSLCNIKGGSGNRAIRFIVYYDGQSNFNAGIDAKIENQVLVE